MDKHAIKMCTNTKFYLQSIRKIRRFLTTESCKILVHTLVTSRLDYANSLLCNISDRITVRLKIVQRSAARLMYVIHRYLRVGMTALLHDLHWLPVVLRIQYKIIVAVFKDYCSGTPQYLANLIVKRSPFRSLMSSQDYILLEEPHILERDWSQVLQCCRTTFVEWTSCRSQGNNITTLKDLSPNLSPVYFGHI